VAYTPTTLNITASQVPTISVTSENATVQYQGLANTALGNAALAVSGTQLLVSNLGSSGQDGLSIAIPPGLTGLEAHWPNLDLDQSNGLPVGAFIKEQMVGTANGLGSSLGMVGVTKTGNSNYVATPDFSAVGASRYIVQAYFQGALVAQATNQNGTPLPITGDFPIFDVGFILNCPGPFPLHPCYPVIVLTGPILLPGPPWPCLYCPIDTLRIAFDPSSIINPATYKLTGLNITASQVPYLPVSGITVSPVTASLSVANRNFALQWMGNGKALLSSNLSLGSWSVVPGATSPFIAPISPAHGIQAYRISQPPLP
jgi:hypothetical protein